MVEQINEENFSKVFTMDVLNFTQIQRSRDITIFSPSS